MAAGGAKWAGEAGRTITSLLGQLEQRNKIVDRLKAVVKVDAKVRE